MKCSDSTLHTPVYLKTSEDMPLPEEEPVYYLLSRDGLFLCRNHDFFQSSVPVEHWPSELAGHDRFFKIKYPKLPRRLLERVVGFFAVIGERYQSEAAVLLAWDPANQRIETLVPDQCGIVGTNFGGEPYPISLDYELPLLPSQWTLIGDIHSHVDGPAYSSFVDQRDEAHRPGLHLVVGRIDLEPPEFHCEISIDGARFPVRNLDTVLAGYHRRKNEVPQAWLDKVNVKTWNSARRALVTYSSAKSYPPKNHGAFDDNKDTKVNDESFANTCGKIRAGEAEEPNQSAERGSLS